MNRPRILRLLRITWTAGCAVVCLLLIVLWVRSYTKWDQAWIGGFGAHRIGSLRGCIEFYSSQSIPFARPGSWGVNVGSADTHFFTTWGFALPHTAFNDIRIIFPHWLPIALSLALAVAPWLKESWRFSLRTLLIAVTLLAVLLGAVIAVTS
jgi:hypothetical protein